MWLALGAARACAGQGAVAGVLCARGHADAAARDAEGICGRHRSGCPARPLVRRRAASPPALRWEPGARVRPDPPRRGRLSDFRSMPRRSGGCRASSWRRWRWARCCGWRRGSCRPAGQRARPRAGRRCCSSLIVGGIAIYGLFLRLFGVTGWREAVNAVRQNRPATCATSALHGNDDARAATTRERTGS